MKIIIQCAASKSHAAGTLKSTDGKPIVFVAKAELAPSTASHDYARPDDLAADGRRWRDVLHDYNTKPGGNPYALLPAWRLYRHRTYAALVERYGTSNVYILSAGWGLIRADFLTPVYDITFSAHADSFKRRRARDVYDDFNMLDDHDDETVVFLGGKDYLPLFCRLTVNYAGPRIAVFNSSSEPQVPGVRFVRYQTRACTNWHYKAARAHIDAAFLTDLR